jgi:microcin C transport system permease protein
MGAYILRRLALIVPTLFGIMLINFVVIQFAPGGPVEQVIAELTQTGAGATDRFSGGGADVAAQAQSATQDAGGGSGYRGAQGLDPEFIKEIERQFGFDRPAHERFLLMLWNYLRFDFGESYFRSASVVELILSKLPVSITLGLWTTLLAYLVSIPLGIAKAVRDGSRFDTWTSAVVIVGYAIPGFLFAILLRTLFAEGSEFFPFFPLRGLWSSNWAELSLFGKALDYLHHIALPILAMAISGFAVLTLLTKNSFLDQIKLQYVATARAKGLSERRVLYGHVFRNAMLIVIAGFPAAFISILFTGSLLIEVIFSLDGLGLLGYEAVLNRDYPIVFGTLYIFGLIGLLLQILTDLVYVWVDPRIDFESREA